MNIWDPVNDHTATISDRVAVSVTPAGYEPKIMEMDVDAEAISPEDLEPRRIELDRNLGTDPYHIHERVVQLKIWRNSEKLVPMCLTSSQRCIPEYDSTESIADSDLEDGELRIMLASPLHLQNREDYESSRMPIATVKPAALLQEQGASAKSAQVLERLDVKFV